MPVPAVTRLTISWSKDTDLALRSYLGSQCLKKGSLSQFIEDAVKWRLFNETVSEVREAFDRVSVDELESMVNDAVTSVRKNKDLERQGHPRK